MWALSFRIPQVQDAFLAELRTVYNTEGVSPWIGQQTSLHSPKGVTESRTCGTVSVAPVGALVRAIHLSPKAHALGD